MTRRLLTLVLFALASACSSSSESPPPPTGAPVILVPANGALLGKKDLTAGQVTFSGTSPGGANVVVQVANLGVCQVTATPGGTWTCLGAIPGGDGEKQARAMATVGSQPSSLSPAVSFTLDATSPAAPVLDASVATTTNAATRAVTGTAEAGASVGLFVDGSFQTTVAAAGGAFAGTVTLPGVDGPTFLTAVAVDAAGNASGASAAARVVVDRTALLSLVAPAAGAHLVAPELASSVVTISGTSEPGAQVAVLLDGVLLATVAVAGDGTWAQGATVSGSARHVASARAVDAVGNVSGTPANPFTISFSRTAALLSPPPYPVTIWGQTVADTAGFGEVFPGQANDWVVDADFSLGAGWGAQYVRALELRVGAVTTPTSHATLATDYLGGGLTPFPSDQAASEVAFRLPRFGAADGVRTAAASSGATMNLGPLAGAASGWLNATSDSRLERTLTFDPAQVYTITWTHEVSLFSGFLVGAAAAPFGPRYQVVLRDPANGMAQLGDPLFVSTIDFVSGTPSVSIAGSLLPAQAVLSFELRAEAPSYAAIDALAVEASLDGPVALANPGFEAGLDPWAASSGAEAQNLESGPRTVGGLAVTRSVYAPPAATWARVVDVFENHGGAPVTTSVVYSTQLGSTLGGPTLAAPSADGSFVVGWEPPPAATSRDVGLVHGSGTAYVVSSDRQVFVVHALTVAPGQAAALVHFVVQTGDASGGATAADVPAQTSAICAQISAGFPAADVYWQDLAPGVIPILRNF